MSVDPDTVTKELTALFVEQFQVPEDKITPDAHLFADLGLDSIDLLSAIAILEERHGISIADDEFPEMLVVGPCVERIARHLAET